MEVVILFSCFLHILFPPSLFLSFISGGEQDVFL